MTEVTKYVLGFAFDDVGRVALIRKEKPEWQKGLWNGIGGKVEPHETDLCAMIREFQEETGVVTNLAHWHYFGSMTGPHFRVEMFKMKDVAIRMVQTIEQEKVELYTMHRLPQCIDNVPGLLSLAQLKDHPYVNLYYGATNLRW